MLTAGVLLNLQCAERLGYLHPRHPRQPGFLEFEQQLALSGIRRFVQVQAQRLQPRSLVAAQRTFRLVLHRVEHAVVALWMGQVVGDQLRVRLPGFEHFQAFGQQIAQERRRCRQSTYSRLPLMCSALTAT